MSVRVVAPCRLHFGLFHVPVDGLTHYPDGRPVRKFGGLGMMIDNPCVTVTATEAEGDVENGSLAERAGTFRKHIREVLRQYAPGRQLAITADGPTEHTGLGVGTALGLCVSAVTFGGMAQSLRPTRPDGIKYEFFVNVVGRGKRSGIGVEGFRAGGFIADGGKASEDGLPPSQRQDFPLTWRIVLVRPPTPPKWYGDRERTAFARGRSAETALTLTDRLIALAHGTIVPAVRNADFGTFAQSIFDFNRLAGEPFHDDQGGPYAGAEVACVIDELIEMGAVGVGQSSWGPTVFAFCQDADEAERLAGRARARFSSATEVTVTAANNTGARLETV